MRYIFLFNSLKNNSTNEVWRIKFVRRIFVHASLTAHPSKLHRSSYSKLSPISHAWWKSKFFNHIKQNEQTFNLVFIQILHVVIKFTIILKKNRNQLLTFFDEEKQNLESAQFTSFEILFSKISVLKAPYSTWKNLLRSFASFKNAIQTAKFSTIEKFPQKIKHFLARVNAIAIIWAGDKYSKLCAFIAVIMTISNSQPIKQSIDAIFTFFGIFLQKTKQIIIM